LPAPNSDFYELAETLPAEELAVVKQVRAFMETQVAPIITKGCVFFETTLPSLLFQSPIQPCLISRFFL